MTTVETTKKSTPKTAAKKGGAFAVVETGGKQYKISEGESIKIEKLPNVSKEGESVVFDKVLLVDDGNSVKVGTPYIDGAKVEAVFEKTALGKKVIVMQFKSKSNYSKKKGHRQPFTQVKIGSIK